MHQPDWMGPQRLRSGRGSWVCAFPVTLTPLHTHSLYTHRVGDDACSFGFKPSTWEKWHDEKEASYGDDQGDWEWKQGSTLTSVLDIKSDGSGTIRYRINDKDLGVAFELSRKDIGSGLTPAISLNKKCVLVVS